VIVDYIEAHRARFGVEPICRVLSEHGVKIAPSSYYERRRQPVTDAELEEAYLANALVTLHTENWSVYGARKLWKTARRAGLDVGRDQVARLMGIAGIPARSAGGTSPPPPGATTPRPGTPTWSSGAGTVPPGSTNCGWPTSPTSGP
jgi:putative transposase